MRRVRLLMIAMMLLVIGGVIYFYVEIVASYLFRSVDKSWIDEVNTLLVEAKPYMELYTGPDLSLQLSYLWENGERYVMNVTDFMGEGMNDLLFQLLRQILLRANFPLKFPFSDPFSGISQMEKHDRMVELYLRFPAGSIDARVPGYDFPQNLIGLRHAWFVLEDNLNQGLQGCILIRQLVQDIGDRWSCWAIQS